MHGIGDYVVPLAATLSIQSLVSMAVVTVPVFTPVAASEIGIPATYVGIYVALIYIGAMISSLPSGGFILRSGAIRVSQGCLALCTIGLAMTATSWLPLIAISALIIGFGYGPVTPATSHILVGNTPRNIMSLTLSLKQTGVPLGGALAGAIVPLLVLYIGWKGAALFVGGLCLILALFAQLTRDRLDRDRQIDSSLSSDSVTGPLKMVFSNRAIIQLAIISFFYAAMQLCLITYLVTYLTEEFGMTLITAGLALSTALTAGIVGRIVWGAIANLLIRPRLMLGLLGVTMSVAAGATALFNPSWPYAAVIIVSALFGATAIGWNGVYLAEVARLAPAGKAGVATGGTLFFTFSGVVVGPPIFGLIVNASGSYPVGFVSFATVTFICGLVLMVQRKRG
jgi:predicted MFS family arabinose efflux permease